jgi:hypothetical protein
MLEAVELYNCSRCTIYAVIATVFIIRVDVNVGLSTCITYLISSFLQPDTLRYTTINPTFVQQNRVLVTDLAFTTF